MNAEQSAFVMGVGLFFALAAGHFFPWHIISAITDEYGRLKRIPAYVYGLSMIGLAFTCWAALNEIGAAVVVGFWFFVVCAGLGTVAGYAIDWLIERRAERK